MKQSNKRLSELDALRGLAALSVVLFHYTTLYGQIYGHAKESYFLNFKYGYLGVQLFFIISGFVIYMTILNCHSIKEFVIKRMTRLYPAYITGVILTFSTIFLFGLKGMHRGFINALFNLSMLQDIIPKTGISSVDGSYWSLAVEIYFYLICCILLFSGFIKKPVALSLITYLFLFIIKYLFINHLIHPIIGDHVLVHFSNLFLSGIMFFKLKDNNHLKYYFVLLLSLLYEFVFNGFFKGIIIGLFFIIFYALIKNKLKILNIKPLLFLGTISYSLYLIHQTIGFIIINNLEKHGFINEGYLLIPLLVSVGLATLITFYIERPLQDLLRIKLKRKEKNVTEVIAA